MPQHDWQQFGPVARFCGACRACQDRMTGQWRPPVNPICPGDDDDRDPPLRRRSPSGSGQRTRELECT